MDPTTYRRRWLILAVLSGGLMIIGLDSLIVNLALPSIQRGVGATASQLQWMVDAYTLPFGGLVMFAGGLADRVGRRLILTIGLTVFLIASLGGALTDSAVGLIACRAGMGVGAAMIMPCTLAIIKHVFPAGEQKRAIFIWSAVAALGTPLGPVVGGLLLEHFWWGSIFWINVPVAGLALLLALWLIPESRNEKHPGLDVVGAVCSVAGLSALIYGVIEAPRQGWGDARTLGLLVAGGVLLAGFVFWELRAPHPMLSRSLFRDKRVSGPAVVIVVQSFAMGSTLFIATQFFQFLREYSPLEAGLRMLAIMAMVLAGPVLRIIDRLGQRAVLPVGLAVVAAADLVISTVDSSADLRMLLGIGLLGLGLGLTMPTSVNSILDAAPSHQSGAGSAVVDSAARVGVSLGVAVVGSILTTSYRNALPPLDGVPAAARSAVPDSVGDAYAVAAQLGDAGRQVITIANRAFTEAISTAVLSGALVILLGAVAAAFLLPGRKTTPPEQPVEPDADADTLRPTVG